MPYGFQTWSLTLREEHVLRVFENRILRRIFGSKRDENEEWRREFIVCTVHLITRVVKSKRLRLGIHVPIFSPTCGPTSEVGSDIGP